MLECGFRVVNMGQAWFAVYGKRERNHRRRLTYEGRFVRWFVSSSRSIAQFNPLAFGYGSERMVAVCQS